MGDIAREIIEILSTGSIQALFIVIYFLHYYFPGKRCDGFVLHLDLEFVVSSDTDQTFTHCLLRIQLFTCKAATLFLSVGRRQKQFRI